MTELFGEATAARCRPVEVGDAMIWLRGFCGSPDLARPGTGRIYCFVNGRAVRDRVLLHAVGEGYRTYVPKGEYPFVILFLECNPDLVDVNVHPAKAEVRFANPGAVHQFVANVVRKTLSTAETAGTGLRGLGDGVRRQDPSVSEIAGRAAVSPEAAGRELHGGAIQETLAPYGLEAPWRPLGQLAQTYLLYEGPGGALLMIDQHAAHERIGFERLKSAMADGALPRQYLLTPVMVDLAPTHIAALDAAQPTLECLGLEIEPFGGQTVAVKAVPALLAASDIGALVTAVAADLEAVGQPSALGDRIDRLLATMACHRQVRAGDRLTPAELEALVGDMAGTVSTDRCPHGRPTWVAIPAQEIAKWFKRT